MSYTNKDRAYMIFYGQSFNHPHMRGRWMAIMNKRIYVAYSCDIPFIIHEPISRTWYVLDKTDNRTTQGHLDVVLDYLKNSKQAIDVIIPVSVQNMYRKLGRVAQGTPITNEVTGD